MTLADILEDIRFYVHDDGDGGQTLTDDEYTIFVNDGMRVIFYKHPESHLASTGQTQTSWTAADADSSSTTLCIDDVFRSALTEYVLYRHYDRDSGDTRHQARAAQHRKNFYELLSPGG